MFTFGQRYLKMYHPEDRECARVHVVRGIRSGLLSFGDETQTLIDTITGN